MRRLLAIFPPRILDYYKNNPVPRVMLPFIAQYLDKNRCPGDSESERTDVMNRALDIVASSAGLKFGAPTDQPVLHDAVNRLIRGWWARHQFEYGVTEGVSDKTILARNQAMAGADKVIAGRIAEISETETHILVRLSHKRYITPYKNCKNVYVSIPKEMPLIHLLKEKFCIIVCIRCSDDSDQHTHTLVDQYSFWETP